MKASTCPICQGEVSYHRENGIVNDKVAIWPRCKVCGDYGISNDVIQDCEEDLRSRRREIQGWLRRESQKGSSIPSFINLDIFDRMRVEWIPSSPPDKIDAFLLATDRKTSYHGQSWRVDNEIDFPMAFAEGPHEFRWLLKEAANQGLIRSSPSNTSTTVEITLLGYDRIKAVQSGRGDNVRAFVAMSFSTEHRSIFDMGIAPALEECGWAPFIVSDIHTESLIDDEIVAGIRSAGMLIADYTGDKQGVYYEAGFARGLGIPVIKTCSEASFIEKKPHFDVNHFQILQWKSEADLHSKLAIKIRALGYNRT